MLGLDDGLAEGVDVDLHKMEVFYEFLTDVL